MGKNWNVEEGGCHEGTINNLQPGHLVSAEMGCRGEGVGAIKAGSVCRLVIPGVCTGLGFLKKQFVYIACFTPLGKGIFILTSAVPACWHLSHAGTGMLQTKFGGAHHYSCGKCDSRGGGSFSPPVGAHLLKGCLFWGANIKWKDIIVLTTDCIR
jgi:hypothetical protein